MPTSALSCFASGGKGLPPYNSSPFTGWTEKKSPEGLFLIGLLQCVGSVVSAFAKRLSLSGELLRFNFWRCRCFHRFRLIGCGFSRVFCLLRRNPGRSFPVTYGSLWSHRPNGAGFSLRSMRPLGSVRSLLTTHTLRSGRTLLSPRALWSRASQIAFGSTRSGWSLNTFRALRSGRPLLALRSLRSGRPAGVSGVSFLS